MKPLLWGILAIAAFAIFSAHDAQANKVSEVVSARANARAGGPVSEHDAWLLERYGALSGTSNNWRRALPSKKRRPRGYRIYRRGY